MVLDVDSTLIQQEVIELIAAHCGVQEKVKAITDRAMAGELDFEASLRERVQLLAGIHKEVLEKVFQEIQVTDGVPELISAVHQLGGKVAVVSGGFIEIVEPLALSLEIDLYHANQLGIENELLNGRIVGEVVDREAKAKALKLWSELENIPIENTIAIGDGANDISMLEAVGFAVGFRPKAALVPYCDLVIEDNSLRELIPLIQSRAS